MRKVSLDRVKPGMILARDIFGDTGQILLRADIELKPRYLSYLEQAGIVNKPGELSADEFKVITGHPLLGFEIFKTTDIFDARAGAVVLQHHERYQGQGYPRGLAGKDIYLLAQIVGIADVYDALTSDRPYRKAYRPHEAVEMLISWGEEMFNVQILQSFISSIAAYPIGSHVLLNNGESGLVVANSPGFTLRPVVRILYRGANELEELPRPYEIDLSRTLDLTITEVID